MWPPSSRGLDHAARITADSRQVRAGDAFAAYPGEKADGRNFIGDAVARGAGAVLWEALGFHWQPELRVPNHAVENLKAKLGAIADFVFGSPSQALWTVGVTGTNGKTSCSQWIARCLDACGRRAACWARSATVSSTHSSRRSIRRRTRRSSTRCWRV